MVIGGTTNVVTPSFPAELWLSAYAHVEKAIAVGRSAAHELSRFVEELYES